MNIIILAGGLGQRLWPLSRASKPKHIQPFFGNLTLLQKTISRLKRRFSTRDLFIVTGSDHARVVYRQLPRFPKGHILIEPARRGTTAAIGLGVYSIARKRPHETIVSIASDHFIEEEDIFLNNLLKIGRVIRADPKAVVLMGIAPQYPETGYGYIEIGKPIRIRGIRANHIKRFVEKPNRKRAAAMIASGQYLWNPAYFGWRADRVQELFRQFVPDADRLLRQAVAGSPDAFRKIKAEAIDYTVMEKLHSHFYVLADTFHWADVGHWDAVRQIAGQGGNATLGLHHAVDTENTLIYNYTSGVIGVIGVRDLLIVQTADGLLVCHKDRAQDVRKLVQALKEHPKMKRFT